MSYLARLKAEIAEKRLPSEPTKPTKAPFVSFVSASSRHISEIGGANDPAPALFDFAPPADPDSDREAIEERAGIIAEGCGMGPDAALREARWEAERERTWRAFLRNAAKLLNVAEGARQGLLDEYSVEARARYGEPTGTYMAETMRRWIVARTTEST